jgi:hypothetical protein
MADTLAGNFLVEGEPFDVTKINKLFVAVQALQEKTSSLENTLKLPDGTIKQYIPVVWGYRTPKLSLKGDLSVSGPFTLDWGNSPFTSSEQSDGKMALVASLAEGDAEKDDYRISFTSAGVPQMYIRYVPSSGKAGPAVTKQFNIIAFYPRPKTS